MGRHVIRPLGGVGHPGAFRPVGGRHQPVQRAGELVKPQGRASRSRSGGASRAGLRGLAPPCIDRQALGVDVHDRTFPSEGLIDRRGVKPGLRHADRCLRAIGDAGHQGIAAILLGGDKGKAGARFVEARRARIGRHPLERAGGKQHREKQKQARGHGILRKSFARGSRPAPAAKALGLRRKGRTRDGDRRGGSLGPVDQRAKRAKQRAPEIGQRIFDARRFRREDRAQDQPVALEIAQRLRQHPARDVGQAAGERVEPARARLKLQQDQRRPFRRNMVEHVAHRAIGKVDLVHPVAHQFPPGNLGRKTCLLSADHGGL
ncbi:hypothetical protein SDC9_26044 [bioreactor metagenome]|uniref:Uncharacterized protein n=1 Tax=bioreactor metagenome TaxID=1076179 RepID=A0A644UMF9_9ZZZZ